MDKPYIHKSAYNAGDLTPEETKGRIKSNPS